MPAGEVRVGEALDGFGALLRIALSRKRGRSRRFRAAEPPRAGVAAVNNGVSSFLKEWGARAGLSLKPGYFQGFSLVSELLLNSITVAPG